MFGVFNCQNYARFSNRQFKSKKKALISLSYLEMKIKFKKIIFKLSIYLNELAFFTKNEKKKHTQKGKFFKITEKERYLNSIDLIILGKTRKYFKTA